MRQSVAPTRASHAASSINPQAPNPASLSRLQEKKKEFEAVAALEKASAAFVKRIEGLGDDCDVMADAGLGQSCSPLSTSSSNLSKPLFSSWTSAGTMAKYVSNIELIW